MKKLFPFLFVIIACKKTGKPEPGKTYDYESAPDGFNITGTLVKEASGITFSKSMPGKLWVEQDSGNPPLLYVLKGDGTITDSVLLEGATNRDWEDITIGGGPLESKSYLYVADIGDNDLKYDEYAIYRFEEPAEGVKKVSAFDKIRFAYPDSSHDAEALLVDNATKDIYIITKRDKKSKVYKIAYPQSTATVNSAQFVQDLPYSGAVSAAVSPSDEEVIVKTYTQLYHYTRKPADPISQTLAGAAVTLGYQVEPQGEAVTFAADNSGFYTLSEEALGVEPRLYFYGRK